LGGEYYLLRMGVEKIKKPSLAGQKSSKHGCAVCNESVMISATKG